MKITIVGTGNVSLPKFHVAEKFVGWARPHRAHACVTEGRNGGLERGFFVGAHPGANGLRLVAPALPAGKNRINSMNVVVY